MRIVCQKCGGNYEIDERLLGARGVRGQCPHCKHQQSVMPESSRANTPGGLSAVLSGPSGPRAAARAGANGHVPEPTPQPRATPPSSPASGMASALSEKCRRCGKALSDPFDQAMGVCEDCRQLLGEQGAMEAGAEPPRGARTQSRPHGVPQASPAPARTLSNPSGPARPSFDARLGVAMTASGGLPPWAKRAIVAGAALVVLGGGVAGGVALYRGSRPQELPRAIQEVLPRWRLEYTDLSGEAKALLADGRKRMAEDRPVAYRDAEESFQRALLLDSMSDEALAGYGTALALGHGDALDEEARREAISLVEAARQRNGETVPELLAQVYLLLAPRRPGSDDLQAARQLAQRALGMATDAEKAGVYVAMGLSYLTTSGQLAVHNLDQALKDSSPPPRAHYYRGLAHASFGEFTLAIRDLERRLQLDPGQPEALAALAGIHEELGNLEQARAVYLRAQSAHPEDPRIPVQLAVLAYQFEGKAKDAALQLRNVLRDEERLEREVALDAYVHLAGAERQAGNLDGAAAAGSRALTISKDDAGAHLQLLWVALQRGRPDEAAAHLPFIVGHLGDRALEHVVAGKVSLAQGRYADAQREYTLGAELDQRRVDAMLGAGVAAARDKRKPEALAALFKAVQSDPTRAEPRRPVTRYWLAEGETLEGLDGTVLDLSSGESDVMPLVYEGVIRFHQGAGPDADRLFARVVEEDGKNSLALSFRALLALQRSEVGRALQFAQKGALNGGRLALARYAFGMALAARGEVEGAKRQFREASALAPSLLASEVQLAQLEALKPAEMTAARERLVRCLALDPTYVAAKRALYALEKREVEKAP